MRYPRNHPTERHLRRKALTQFRESATPRVQRTDFSPAFPRLRPRGVAEGISTEVPFLRHFSVMAGGIKTYPPAKRKMLFGDPVWANTSCVLASPSFFVVPTVHRWTQDLVFDSDLPTMCS